MYIINQRKRYPKISGAKKADIIVLHFPILRVDLEQINRNRQTLYSTVLVKQSTWFKMSLPSNFQISHKSNYNGNNL